MQIRVKENFLSDRDCEFLINYHKRFYNESTCGHYWDRTYVMRMGETPLFHVKKSLIRRKYLGELSKQFPYLELQYDQVVHWSSGSFLDLHYDIDYPHEGEGSVNDFVTVCYLNDNFEGGETVLDYNDMKPKRGKLIAFPSKEILHGVKPVRGDRYTHIAWWRISNAN